MLAMRRPLDNAAALTPFPLVEDRVRQSTELWARDLRSLYDDAKERFSDVSWETDGGERVYAHKAVVYVRAPKAFKDRYFITTAKSLALSRSPTSLSGAASPSPYLLSAGSLRTTPSPSLFGRRGSNLSVDTAESDGTLRAPTLSIGSGAGPDGVLRLRHDDPPELFRAQLEWLYTGEGFGDVVEWISEENRTTVRDSLGRRGNLDDRRDKLGQDLAYMWTSKLYSDVRIHIDEPGGQTDSDDSDGSDDSLATTVIFTAHRFMLVTRSPYFASVLLNPSEFRPATADVYLLTPPFTPAALHFCLGWMYAGHLDFSNRSYDLLTAFQIHRAAEYLQLDTLVAEIESRLVYEFCHGMEWDKCHCRQCLARVPRVWRFAGSSDVGALELQRRARRFLLRGWGDAWGREVGSAEKSERDDLVKDVLSALGPNNLVSTFRGIAHVRARMDHGLRRKGPDAGQWVDALGDMVEVIQKRARDVLASNFSAFCESPQLWDLLSGKGFHADVLDLVLSETVSVAGRAPSFLEAPKIYQSLVSSILLKVDPETLETALPTRSLNRQKVEEAKEGIVAHLKKRWLSIQNEGGFLGLEPWALKEISDEIEVPIEDLLARQLFPRSVFPREGGYPRPGSRPVAVDTRSPPPSSSDSQASIKSPTEAPEPNGLRRLRLSSSASVSSVTSARTAASRAAVTPRQTVPAGPHARSPTAAEKTPVVSLGSRNRNSVGRPQSPTPMRPAQVMSGPPRPLLTGTSKSAVSKVQQARDRSGSPSSPLATTSRTASPSLRRQPSLASVKSTTSTRTNGTARTTATTRTNATTRTSGTSSTNAMPPRPAAARPATKSFTNGSSSKQSARGSEAAAGPSRPRSSSVVSTASRVSVATSIGGKSAASTTSKASALSTKSTAPSRPAVEKVPAMPPRAGATVAAAKAKVAHRPLAPVAAPKVPTQKALAAQKTLRPSASSKSLSGRTSTPSSATATPPLPKTPVPTKGATLSPSTPGSSTSGSARVRATSLNPKASPPSATRQRTASSAAPWKRATPLPTGVAGVPGAKPRPSLRSLSGSTDGTHEAITPRVSQVHEEPAIAAHDEPPLSSIPADNLDVELKLLPTEEETEPPPELSTLDRMETMETPPRFHIIRPSTSEIPQPPPTVPVSHTTSSTPSQDETTPTAQLSSLPPTPTQWPIPPSPASTMAPALPETPQSSAVRGRGSPLVSAPSTHQSPLNVIFRVASETGSLLSLNAGWHPALAFDPPKRQPTAPPVPKLVEPEDDNLPFTGPGISLHVGIPCIVTLAERRARFRANVKYLGALEGKRGAWVGLEVEDLERLGVDTMPTGARDGVRYFHFTPALSTAQDDRTQRARRIAAIADELAAKARGEPRRIRSPLPPAGGLGVGLAPDPRRAASPYTASEWGPPEKPRALFVRPSEVVFVLGAD